MKRNLFGSEELWLLSRLLRGKAGQLLYLDYPVDMKPRYGGGQSVHAEIGKKIEKNNKAYSQWLGCMVGALDGLGADDTLPWKWSNGWLPPLDVLALYQMLAEHKPKQYIEIGSGVSTQVAALAKSRAGLKTKIMSIDPEPRESIVNLVDMQIVQPLEHVDLSLFEELDKGDMVFMDGSHVALMNSDVTVFFLEVLPRLKHGVVVQVHDVYWPYDYQWSGLEYNEQYLLGMYLLFGMRQGEILFPSFYVSKEKRFVEERKQIAKQIGLALDEVHGGSFWFLM